MNVKTSKDFPAPGVYVKQNIFKIKCKPISLRFLVYFYLGAYNISEELTSSRSRAVQAPFKSTLQRDMINPKSILENPGPAAYHPYNIEPTHKPNLQ